MKMSAKTMVSNSLIIKNYKGCREKSKAFGKIFILKNNQLDAVLFSIDEYERLSVIIEYLESHEETDINTFFGSLPKEEKRKNIRHDQFEK